MPPEDTYCDYFDCSSQLIAGVNEVDMATIDSDPTVFPRRTHNSRIQTDMMSISSMRLVRTGIDVPCSPCK